MYAALSGALLLTLVAAATTEGSLLLPPAPEYQSAEFLEQLSAEESPTTSSGETEEVEASEDEPEVPLDLIARLMKAHGSSSSSSQTGGSSSPGSSGAEGMSFVAPAALLVDDDCGRAERIGRERALILPWSPRDSIFRPPRVAW